MRRNRVAGAAMCVTLGLLVLTGYDLYYFDGDMLRRVDEWLHWGCGFFLRTRRTRRCGANFTAHEAGPAVSPDILNRCAA